MQIPATHAKALWKRVKTSLTALYGEEEATSISFRLMEDLAGINKSSVLAEHALAAEVEEIILSALNTLKKGIPVQYVIGFTWFAGLKIEVNPSVLIPRPETEELFYLVKNEHQGPKKIVDWCSGSGCLTLALQLAFPNGVVYGLEFSAQAIDTAKKSSSALGIQPCWRQSNIFEAWPEEIRNCDIIVSNPPYVAQKEAGYCRSMSLIMNPTWPYLFLIIRLYFFMKDSC